MIRKIITIDQEKCTGCGLCVTACHEGAIGLENGKAVLLREDYCDGLGDCLPACPTGAITFEEREAAACDEAAVLAAKAKKEARTCQCPGSQARAIQTAGTVGAAVSVPSQLRQWPVQIKLVPVNAPYFDGAHLLIAADCTAYAYANFHQDFIRGKITLVGCPKLDGVDYTEKLTHIIRDNHIKALTVVHMEVPCCGGLERAVQKALAACGRPIPFESVTLSVRGEIL